MPLALARHAQQKPLPGWPIDRSHPLAQGLVFYLPLNEGGGTAVTDLASGNIGTVLINTSPANGWQTTDRGVTYHGTTGTPKGSITVPATTVLAPTNGTFALWARQDGAGAGGGLMGKPSGTGWQMYLSNTTTWFFETNGNFKSATISADVTKWHHYCVTLLGTTIRWYLDGVQVTSATGAAMPAYSAATVNLCVVSGSNGWPGWISEPGIWNRALAIEEIEQLYYEPFAFLRQPNHRRFFAYVTSTAYTRSLSSSIAHSATLTRSETLTRVQSSAVAHTATVARSETLTRAQASSIAQSTTLTRTQALSRAQSSSIAHSATTARAVGFLRALSSGIAHTATLSRVQTLARGVSSAIAHVATVASSQALTRALSSAISHTATVARSQALVRSLSSAIGHMVTVSTGHAMMRALSSSIAHAATVTRGLASTRSLASSIAHSATVTRAQSLTRTLTMAIAHVATVAGTHGLNPTAVALFIARPLATQWQATSLLRSWLAAPLLNTWRARRRR